MLKDKKRFMLALAVYVGFVMVMGMIGGGLVGGAWGSRFVAGGAIGGFMLFLAILRGRTPPPGGPAT